MSEVRSILWAERIDGDAFAACARFEEVHKGDIYAASTFLLVSRSEKGWHGWRDKVEAKLRDEMERKVHLVYGGKSWEQQRRGMPLVGRVRDLRR